MMWIEGVERIGGHYLASTIDETGQRKPVQPKEIKKTLNSAMATKRVKLTTRFGDWERVAASEYLNGLGFTGREKENQHVFSFFDAGVRYMIPASVLIPALFRPIDKLACFLFQPAGLDRLCVPNIRSELPSVSFLVNGLSIRERERASVHQPLHWMSCFASARQMWYSVYQHATQGILGIDLPTAKATIVLKGVRRGGTIFVTDACIVLVTPEEAPFPFAENAQKTYILHDNAGEPLRAGKPAPAPRVLKNGSNWELSDFEWRRIESLVTSPFRAKIAYKHDLRQLVNTILKKFGSGIAWRKLELKSGNWNNAQFFYRRWQKDQRWGQVLNELAAIRAA